VAANLPGVRGLFPRQTRAGRLVPLASGYPDDAHEALPIRANARVLGATLKAGQAAEYQLGTGRHAYLVPSRGTVAVNGVQVAERDGAAISEEQTLRIEALDDSEIVLVDAA
jgi:quercetin 2,3-dioxygenase